MSSIGNVRELRLSTETRG